MNVMEFANRLSLETLTESLEKLGLDPKMADDKEDAIELIYDHFDGMVIEFECENCGGELPDISFCPFCGLSLESDLSDVDTCLPTRSKGIPGEFYEGAGRGRKPKSAVLVSGESLFKRLVGVLGIHPKRVKRQKSVASLWSDWGMFARCFINVYSVRLHIPFQKYKYDDPNYIVIQMDHSIKNMHSRMAVESYDDIEDCVEILKQSIILKKLQYDDKIKLKNLQKEEENV